MLGRTSHLLCTVAALLVSYHDPLRLAEEVACADLLSGGNRLVLIIGLGYRESEFEMFGKDRRRRGQLVEAAVDTMLRAWTGEPFEYQGRTVRVTPRPMTRPHPTMMIGGSAEISARRAARFHLPFMPPVADDDLARAYYEEAEKVGFGSPFVMMPSGPGAVIVSDDPDRVGNEARCQSAVSGADAAARARPDHVWSAQDGHAGRELGSRGQTGADAGSPASLRQRERPRAAVP